MNHLIGTAYNFVIRLAALLLAPIIVIKGGFRDRTYFEYLGLYPKAPASQGQRPIWIHCASVGEAKVAAAVIEEIRRQAPAQPVVLTVCTRAGRKMAERLLGAETPIRFLPLDLRCCMRRALSSIDPQVLVLTETELYPNLMRLAVSSGVEQMLINGRVSSKSYLRYLALRDSFAPALGSFGELLMQTDEDCRRIVSLGGNPDRCEVMPNIKYDLMRRALSLIDPSEVRRRLHLDAAPILVAGSTRGGEERSIAEQFLRLKADHPRLRLILAPRHLDRVAEVGRYLSSLGLKYAHRSRIAQDPGNALPDVMILDTMGELTDIYSVAAAAFVGGSLVPKGGQNPLEPIGLGTPTCFGPHMENFGEIARTVLQSGLAVQVQSSDQLYEFFRAALEDRLAHPNPRPLFERFGNSAACTARRILERCHA